MQLLHEPNDPLLDETLRHIISNVLESAIGAVRVDTGKITLPCTMNTLKTATVAFNKPFKSTPFIILGKNPSIASSVVTESYSNPTAAGFTAHAYTSSTQDVDITYLAIGNV